MKQKDILDRVTHLTSAMLDGVASSDELKELNDLLNGDPDACERYLDLVETHANLVQEHSADDQMAALEKTVPFSSSPKPASKSATFNWWPLVAAAAAVALLVNGLALWNPTNESTDNETVSDNAGVAVLSRVVDAVWDDSSVIPVEGDAINSGSVSLKSGLAQLEFFSGATVIIEGPAEIDLKSAWEIECQSGKLRAFVPEPAQGFTIETADYRAVDLGTEFALSVSPDGSSEVHVVDGEVRLDDHDGKELRFLKAGNGILSRDKHFEPVEGGGSSFIDRERLLGLAHAEGANRFREWQSARDKLLQDESTLVLFDFEDQNPWDRQLQNRIENNPNGAIIGSRWTEGRWPGKGALEFKRITDRVRLNIPGEFDQLTFATWVRIEGLDRWLSSLILTDGFETGEVHWQISDKGELVLGISTGKGDPNTTSPPVIHPDDLGRWLHIAVTVNRTTGDVAHYLNGKEVVRDNRPNLPPLLIGQAEIGNWRPQQKSHPIRSLNGRVDEFVVLKRAVTADEILQLYLAGNPNG